MFRLIAALNRIADAINELTLAVRNISGDDEAQKRIDELQALLMMSNQQLEDATKSRGKEE